jgi:hypothetical protein
MKLLTKMGLGMADNKASLCRLKLQSSPCQTGKIGLEVTIV